MAVLRVALVASVFSAALLISDHHGVPDDLPGIALNWPLLFHVERASALLGALGAVALVGWRATHGEFPVKFGQVEYEKKAAKAAEDVSEAQERRLRLLEVLNGIRDPSDI